MRLVGHRGVCYSNALCYLQFLCASAKPLPPPRQESVTCFRNGVLSRCTSERPERLFPPNSLTVFSACRNPKGTIRIISVHPNSRSNLLSRPGANHSASETPTSLKPPVAPDIL